MLAPFHYNKEGGKRPEAAVLRILQKPREVPPMSPQSQGTHDSDNAVFALNGRTTQLQYTVFVINQNAARLCREELVNSMQKSLQEFFKSDKHASRILARADELNTEGEERFVSERCSAYEFPLFNVPQSELE